MIVGCALDWQNAVGSLTDYPAIGHPGPLPQHQARLLGGPDRVDALPLERIDYVWDEFRDQQFGNRLDQPPSTYARGRVFGCLFDDQTGLRNRDAIGMDQICYETDYPHAQATWPTARRLGRLCAKAGLSDRRSTSWPGAMPTLRTAAVRHHPKVGSRASGPVISELGREPRARLGPPSAARTLPMAMAGLSDETTPSPRNGLWQAEAVDAGGGELVEVDRLAEPI